MPGICLQVSGVSRLEAGWEGSGAVGQVDPPPHPPPLLAQTDKHRRSVSAFNSTPPTLVTYGAGEGLGGASVPR